MAEKLEICYLANRDDNLKFTIDGNGYKITVNGAVKIYQSSHVKLKNVTIDLVVSKGPEKLKMPNLLGNPKNRAVEKLLALGLGVEVYEEYSDEVKDRVFKTSPAADEEVTPGSVVKIYLSKGPKPEEEKPVEPPVQDNPNTGGDTNTGGDSNTDGDANTGGDSNTGGESGTGGENAVNETAQ